MQLAQAGARGASQTHTITATASERLTTVASVPDLDTFPPDAIPKLNSPAESRARVVSRLPTPMADGKEDRTHGRWGPFGRAVAKILDHPRTALAVGVVGLAATVVTFELSQGGSGTRAISSASGVQFKIGKPPPLNLNEGANCADLEQAALHSLGRTVFIEIAARAGASSV